MKSCCALVLMSLVLAVGAAHAQVQSAVRASVSFNLGIRGADRQPDVLYTVTQPTGDVSTATAIAPYDGERPGDVTYPDDFTNAGMHPGTYTWTATVDGKEMAAGEFEYVPLEGGLQTRVKY